MNKGMKDAQEVILSGTSAGGLATYIHADYVASVLPQSAKFHALADAGYIRNSLVPQSLLFSCLLGIL